MKRMDDNNYYKISLSYEIPFNILDSEDEDIKQATSILYDTLKESLPEKYERFSIKLVLYQLKDTFNYLVTFDAFFRSIGELPMAEYVEARDVKNKIKEEIEEFFNSVDCEYNQINIISLL